MTSTGNDAPLSRLRARETIEAARAFAHGHASEPGIGDTYGYFTSHPVAPLNRRRLVGILECLSRKGHALGRPLRVLDVACGGGLITRAAAALGNRVLGIDLSADEIRLARGFIEETGAVAAEFERVDVIGDPSWERLAEERLMGKPDAVVLAYALHHLPEVERFCARLGAWLAPGSILVVNEENPRSPLFRLKHRVRTWIQKDTETEWHRTYAGWRVLLEDSGFEIGRPRGFDPVPGWGRLLPGLSWSLVFEGKRR